MPAGWKTPILHSILYSCTGTTPSLAPTQNLAPNVTISHWQYTIRTKAFNEIMKFIAYFRSMELQVFRGFQSGRCETYGAVYRLLTTVVYLMSIKFSFGTTGRFGRKQLTSVPSGLSPDITLLGLHYNEITELGPDNFPGLTLMKELDLRGNRISYIDDLAFQSCIALIKLNLKENRLVHMPATFGPNSPNMIRFFLTDNPCTITAPWLEQFRSLTILNIEAIGMEEFPSDLLRGLINLNTLTIGSSKAPNLTERRLSLKWLTFNNHIGSTFPEEHFMNMETLQTVTMFGGDRMITLPRFLGATGLTKLNLQFEIESLPDLSHLRRLKELSFPTTSLVCDYRLCWALFESFKFSLGHLDNSTIGCSLPPVFRGRAISSISKLELACYHSRFMRKVLISYTSASITNYDIYPV